MYKLVDLTIQQESEDSGKAKTPGKRRLRESEDPGKMNSI